VLHAAPEHEPEAEEGVVREQLPGRPGRYDAVAVAPVADGPLLGLRAALPGGTTCAMLAGTPESFLQEQVAYYAARAAEYSSTSYENLTSADRRIARLVSDLHPDGDLLEIACGAGIWTRHLAGCVRSVTAIDAVPEMIAQARRRVPGETVTFLAAISCSGPRRGASTPSSSPSGCRTCPHRSLAGSGPLPAAHWPAAAVCCSSTTSLWPLAAKDTWQGPPRSLSAALPMERPIGSSSSFVTRLTSCGSSPGSAGRRTSGRPARIGCLARRDRLRSMS
jgi:methyltransferase family protein